MIFNVPGWVFSLSVGVCYLVGSIPCGYLVARAKGINIQEAGSGNIGATNVGRVLGKKWGVLVFALDFSKSFVPLLLLPAFLKEVMEVWRGDPLLVVCGLVAIIGHNYTPWLRFKGGKGIATSAGVLAALMPWSLAVVVAVFALVLGVTRIVSIGSVMASLALPVATYFLYPGRPAYLGFAFLAGALGVWRHRVNLQRWKAGTEPKIGAGRAA
jgi:glycerol-3-phosphate acyltransferase PlsY